MSLSAVELATWREADRLLVDLLELPPETQDSVIAGLEIAEDVRVCLQRLIDAHGSTGPLDQELALLATAPEKSALSGQYFGHWKLEEEIGRGGMAVVYRCSRTETDFIQQAALKLLPRGMAGLARFQMEQGVLARFEHPHIARFLDGGIADDDTPWLAMELVNGVRVDEACREMGPAEKIRMMLPIIDAVAHAHRHLVIHRDLKPSNILVDADGRPRLLDFGIAKLLSDDQSLAATRILTPEYCAPEQVNGSEISTATDVFGLGAVLHELITGSPPNSAYGQRIRALEDVHCDRDLKNIIDKALRESPQDRYATAQELGADLESWLSGKPVRATPGSRRYRLGKWLKRNRLTAVATIAISLSIISAVIVVSWQARETAAQAQVVFAQNTVLQELLASPQAIVRGRQVRVVDVLEDAAQTIDLRLPLPSTERAELFATLARTLQQLGDGHTSITLWERAIADLEASAPGNAQPRLLNYRIGLARAFNNIENYPAARSLLEAAEIKAHEQWEANDPIHAEIALDLYQAKRLEDVAGALAAFENADRIGSQTQWRSSNDRGRFECGRLQALEDLGRFAQAARSGREFLDWSRQQFGEQHSYTLCAYQRLVTALSREGDLVEAERIANQGEAVAVDWLGQNDRFVYTFRHTRANIIEEQGRFQEAIELNQALLDQRDQVPGLDTYDRIMPLQSMAVAYLEAGNYAAAEPLQLQFIDFTRLELGENDPETLVALVNLAELRIFDGRSDEARELAFEAHERLSNTLGPDHPVTLFARGVHGGSLVAGGDSGQALEILDGLPDQLAEAFGQNDINVVNVRIWLASALLAEGREAEARPILQDGLQWRLEHFGEDHPRTREVQALLTAMQDR